MAIFDVTVQELWQCDGCGATGTEEEMEAHVVAVNTLPGGSLKDPQDVTCWGSYLVGGPAWDVHQFEGVHPMQTLMAQVQIAAMESGVEL